jgi:hypothetical protein
VHIQQVCILIARMLPRLCLGAGLAACLTACDPASPPATEQLPAAVAIDTTAQPVEEPEAVPTEAVSPSSAFSKRLRGVFIRSVSVEPTRIRLGDSIDVEIKEAWAERLWECKQGGLFGDDDCSTGYALDSTAEYPRAHLVLAITPASRLGRFDDYSWTLSDAKDRYDRHLFHQSRSGRELVIYFRHNAFPAKFYVSACLKPGKLCESQRLDSLLIR